MTASAAEQADLLDLPGVMTPTVKAQMDRRRNVGNVVEQQQWVTAATRTVEAMARLRASFTTDDLMDSLEKAGTPLGRPGVFGPILGGAAHRGLVRASDQWVLSRRQTDKPRPVRVWVSLVATPTRG